MYRASDRDPESSGPSEYTRTDSAVHVAVSAVRVADDVVVDVGVDDDLAGGNALNVRARSDEALFLSGPEGEHECRVELQAAAGEHACQLHRQSRAASVVVGAGSIDVVVLVCAELRVRRLDGQAFACWRQSDRHRRC